MDSQRPRRFLIIIGAARAGSTSLFDLMASHPALGRPVRKELNFFSTEDLWATHTPSLADYQALWPTWNTDLHSWALEASGHYTLGPQSVKIAERARETLEGCEVRLVYILRHPLERIRSGLDFAAPRRIAKGRSARPRNLEGIAWASRYAYHLDSWTSQFPRSPVLLLRFEDLARQQVQIAQAILRHCGLPDTWEPPQYFKRNASGARQAVKPQWKSLVNIVPSSYRQKLNLRAWVPKSVQSFVQRKAPPPAMLTDQDRANCIRFLQEDLNRLESVYGFDLKPWNLDQEPAWNPAILP
ncbi:MAG: sulfotransferase [Gloeomargaritaceae cyanobacterium C42_A2020_066]|nr:sulfotransferase [Gloeomargaritaceae cyanobacterium C42_A2020_066]